MSISLEATPGWTTSTDPGWTVSTDTFARKEWVGGWRVVTTCCCVVAAGCVSFLPGWLAPNLITLTGTLALIVSYLVSAYYAPDFEGVLTVCQRQRSLDLTAGPNNHSIISSLQAS